MKRPDSRQAVFRVLGAGLDAGAAAGGVWYGRRGGPKRYAGQAAV